MDAQPALQAPGASAEHRRDQAWVWQVTALCVALGLMLALAVRTTHRIRDLGLPSNRHGVSAAALSQWEEQNEELEGEIQELREQVNDFRANLSDEGRSAQLLKKQLQEYRALTGFAPVEGPGIKIKLRHSPIPIQRDTKPSDYWVSDQDVNGLVSELRAAGAEAISISEAGARKAQRFVVTTTVYSAGKDVVVNGQTLTAPFEIRAIGNPKELRAAMEMPDGIVQNRSLDLLKMIEFEESRNLGLPAYSTSRGARNAPAARE